MSRAVKADKISVVEPTQPLRLARQSKDNGEARTFVPASFLFILSQIPILSLAINPHDMRNLLLLIVSDLLAG